MLVGLPLNNAHRAVGAFRLTKWLFSKSEQMAKERSLVVAWRIGIRSVRANAVPMVVLWLLAAATVWAYYAVPAVAATFEPLRRWQTESGWSAAFLNRVFFNGLLPGVLLLAIPSIRPRHVLLVIAAQALWGGCWGVVTDFFFRWLDVLFGSGHDFATLFCKMMLDEFGLTLFLVAPADAVFFFWVGRDFSVARAWRERPRQFVLGQVTASAMATTHAHLPFRPPFPPKRSMRMDLEAAKSAAQANAA